MGASRELADGNTAKNNIGLSNRLLSVAAMVSPGQVAADVGCDHGYVSIWLLKNGICPRVIAMDVRKGPLAAAEEHIREYGLSGYIETRLSDGLAALKGGEAGVLLLAGMGGRLMVRILEEEPEKVSAMQELILQPQSEIALVRQYVRGQGFAIVQENMVSEDGKYYPMFRVLTRKGLREAGLVPDADGYAVPAEKVLKRSDKTELYDNYGKLLLTEQHPVLQAFLQKEEQVCKQIERSVQEKAAEGEDRRKRLMEVEKRLRLVRQALSFYPGQDGLR